MNTADVPIILMRTWVAALNARDRARCQAVWCENALWTNRATGMAWSGPQEITEQLWRWHDTCPDLRVELTDAFSNDSRGAIEATWTGTRTGVLLASRSRQAAAGNRLRWSTCYVVDTRNGKLSTLVDYYDPWRILPYQSSFPALASVEAHESAISLSVARGSRWRSRFPALALLDTMTSFPGLAGVQWEEPSGEPSGPRPDSRAQTSFPHVARSRW